MTGYSFRRNNDVILNVGVNHVTGLEARLLSPKSLVTGGRLKHLA